MAKVFWEVSGFKSAVFGFGLLFLFVVIPSFARAQEYYPYYSPDTLKLFNTAVAKRNSFVTALPIPAGVNAEYRAEYKKIINAGAQHAFNTIRYAGFADSVTEPYVNAIYQRILKANKLLPPSALYVSRSPVANAYAMLDGTIFLNIGLLSRLENESQLAFIICHELGHVYFKHTHNSLKKELDQRFDKDFQREIKRVSREQYNVYSKLGSLFQNVSLNNLYHDRKVETQADSMGYVLMARAGFDASQAYTALQLLDKIDEPLSGELLDLPKFFTCQDFNYTFATKTVKPKSIFNVKPDTSVMALSDTLKTHPDCTKRMRYILRLAQLNPPAIPVTAENKGQFARVKQNCQREVVQSYFDLEKYDLVLFNSLLLLKKDPDSEYLTSMVNLSLYHLKLHLENHTYYGVVSRLSPNLPENFGQLVALLHNLKTSDFKGFSECFNQAYRLKAEPNEYTLAARYTFLVLKDTVSEAEEVKKQYFKNYKGGRLEKLLFAEAPETAKPASRKK